MWFPRPKRVEVKFGAPLDLSALRSEAASCPKPRLKEVYQEIAVAVMRAISALEPRPDGPALDPENNG
jgi:hypothetical protein